MPQLVVDKHIKHLLKHRENRKNELPRPKGTRYQVEIPFLFRRRASGN